MQGGYGRDRAEVQDLSSSDAITFPATFDQLDEWKHDVARNCGMTLSYRVIVQHAFVLFARTDKDGRLVADPTYEQLAKAAGCSVRTAKRVMAAAEKTVVVRKLRRSDGRVSNIWELMFPADEAPEKTQEIQCPTVPNFPDDADYGNCGNRATVGTVLRESSTLIDRYTSYEERGYVPSLNNTDRDVSEDTGTFDPERVPELPHGRTIEAGNSFPTTLTDSAPVGALEEFDQRSTDRPEPLEASFARAGCSVNAGNGATPSGAVDVPPTGHPDRRNGHAAPPQQTREVFSMPKMQVIPSPAPPDRDLVADHAEAARNPTVLRKLTKAESGMFARRREMFDRLRREYPNQPASDAAEVDVLFNQMLLDRKSFVPLVKATNALTHEVREGRVKPEDLPTLKGVLVANWHQVHGAIVTKLRVAA
jgi:hypothetical protein